MLNNTIKVDVQHLRLNSSYGKVNLDIQDKNTSIKIRLGSRDIEEIIKDYLKNNDLDVFLPPKCSYYRLVDKNKTN